jgi:hypothetical protein
MTLAPSKALSLAAGLILMASDPSFAQGGPPTAPQTRTATVRIAGTVRDETNAIPLPGIPVEVTDTKQTVYTDVDGRYVVDVPPGEHTLSVSMDGYQARTVNVTAGTQNIVLDIALTMNRFAQTVEVTAAAIDVPTSTRGSDDRAQAGVGHHRQRGLPGNEEQRRW